MTEPRPNPMADRLRALLAGDALIMMPCCFDALSAKLIQQAGFDLTFLSGFAASASRIGAPDVGLMSYGEVRDQARNVKWSGKFGQRAKMYPTLMNGYENDEATALFRQV